MSVLRRTHPALMASACLAVAGFVASSTLVARALAPSSDAEPPRSNAPLRRSDPAPSVALEPVGTLRVRFALRADARRRSPPSGARRRARRPPASTTPASNPPASNDRTAPVARRPTPAPQPRPAPRRPAATKPKPKPQPKTKPAPPAAPDFDDAGPPEPGGAGSQPPG